MPTLRSQHADLEFHIVGARPAARVRALQTLPGVQVSGTVPDVRPYLQHAALVVAPLRIARGIQNKVLEAMAMQKTVIASPQALEGIQANHGAEVLCANGGAEFISLICRQLHAPDPRIGLAARQRILRDYRWSENLLRLGSALGVETAAQAMEPAP
jgi:glycosyltransferase involved in cell wall biosynthesis